MKVILICPSNLLYMPYISNYIEILTEKEIEYKVINWDRFRIEKESELTYRDKKIGHQRSIFDYYRYKKFVIKKLKENPSDKIVVFGLQITFFLKKYLQRNYKKKYIIDIRDYSKILRIFNPIKAINYSCFVTISSPAYKKWLPNTDKYVVNHNINKTKLDSFLSTPKTNIEDENIISYVGSITNLNENIDLINTLKNKENFTLVFHGGDTEVNSKLNTLIKNNNINNVEVYGRYLKEEEAQLYNKTTFTNMVLYNKNINDMTCIANRVYHSALYGKPMIAIKGTYISEIIVDYKLGVVVTSLDKIEDEITKYKESFNVDDYNKARIIFLKEVMVENNIFYSKLINFMS